MTQNNEPGRGLLALCPVFVWSIGGDWGYGSPQSGGRVLPLGPQSGGEVIPPDHHRTLRQRIPVAPEKTCGIDLSGASRQLP